MSGTLKCGHVRTVPSSLSRHQPVVKNAHSVIPINSSIPYQEGLLERFTQGLRGWTNYLSFNIYFQTPMEMDKYLPQNGPMPSPTIADKKYRRESASVVDEYFADEKPAPYSLNINVILPNTTHLRTGLYRPAKPVVPQIKTEPGVDTPCNSQALPDFTSVFSVPQTVNSLFIKPDMGTTDELHIGPQQPQVYQMPVSSSDFTSMTFSHSQSVNGAGRTMLNLNAVALTTPSGDFVMPEQFYPQTQPHSLPPSPPNSQPASPENQAELINTVAPPPPYQARVGLKVGQMTPHSVLMTHGQGVLTGPRYNRRNNPELEKRRIHHCDFPGWQQPCAATDMLLYWLIFVHTTEVCLNTLPHCTVLFFSLDRMHQSLHKEFPLESAPEDTHR